MADDDKLDESRFEALADETLERFMDAIDEALGDAMDVDNRQIWMSSPKSGATHYKYDPATGRWVSTRGGADLAATLSAELGDVDLG
jgi:frataxin